MKSFLFIVLLSLVCVCNVRSQSIGLYGGLNKVSMSGDKPTGSKYVGKAGGLYGFLIDFKLTDDVSLSFQPGFRNANASLAYLIDSVNTYKDSIDLNIKTAVLPVIFNVLTNNEKWYFSSGLAFGFISSSTATIVDTGEKIDLSAETSRYNISLNFGITYLIHLGKPLLTLSARYNQGLTNLTNSEGTDSYVPRIKSSGIQFLLGLRYPLKK